MRAKKGGKKLFGLPRKRLAGKLPPHVRNFLARYGTSHITAMRLVRVPIESFTQRLLELVSVGTYSDAVHSANYDAMFHLAMEVYGEAGVFTLEKRAVISLSRGRIYSNRPNTQYLDVGGVDPNTTTWNDLFARTRQRMGDELFTGYDARHNNCQDFLLQVLASNGGLVTSEVRQFIKQDAESIFRRMPSFTEKFARLATDLAAVADKVVEGEGYRVACHCGSVVRRDNLARHKKTKRHRESLL